MPREMGCLERVLLAAVTVTGVAMFASQIKISPNTESSANRGGGVAPTIEPTVVPPTEAPPTPVPRETPVPTQVPDQMKQDLDQLEALLPTDMVSLRGVVKNVEVTLGNGKKAEMPVNFKGEKIKVIYDDGTVEWVTGLPFRNPETDDTYYLTLNHGQTPLRWVNNSDKQTGYFGIPAIEANGLPKASDGYVNHLSGGSPQEIPWWVYVGGGAAGLGILFGSRRKGDGVEKTVPRQSEGRSPDEVAALAKMADQMIIDNAVPLADRKRLRKQSARAKRIEEARLAREVEQERREKRARDRQESMENLVAEHQMRPVVREARDDVDRYKASLERARKQVRGKKIDRNNLSSVAGPVGEMVEAASTLVKIPLVQSAYHPEVGYAPIADQAEAKFSRPGVSFGTSVDIPGDNSAKKLTERLARAVLSMASRRRYQSLDDKPLLGIMSPDDASPVDLRLKRDDIGRSEFEAAMRRNRIPF